MSLRDKRAMLAHWLAQQKTTRREREDAQEQLELWFKRAKLALDKGELELARSAKDRAAEAREEYRKATARLVEIEEELEKIRSEKTVPNQDEVDAAMQRAEHAAQEFGKLGIDPRFAALGDASKMPDLPPEASAAAGASPAPRSAFDEAEALLDEAFDDDAGPAIAGADQDSAAPESQTPEGDA